MRGVLCVCCLTSVRGVVCVWCLTSVCGVLCMCCLTSGLMHCECLWVLLMFVLFVRVYLARTYGCDVMGE